MFVLRWKICNADKVHAPLSLALNGTKSFPRRKEGCIYKGCKEDIMNIIDVNRSKLNCALIDNSNHRKLKFKVVSNSEEGFVTLIDWLAKRTKSSISAYHYCYGGYWCIS